MVAGRTNKKDDRRRNRLKTIILLIFSLILLIIVTIAWFMITNSVRASSMSVKVQGDRYVISSTGQATKYLDYYNAIEPESGAMIWNMSSSSNMANYSVSDEGIEPGSHGIVTFNVTPNVDSLLLSFNFELIGYVSGVDSNDEITMTEVNTQALRNYLNGHILLFENCDANGVYSGPILSDVDMNRVLSKSFSSSEGTTPVDIYWVWPEYLCKLVDVYDGETILEHPLCSGTDYTALIGNVCSFPQYYFRGNSFSGINEQTIINNYSTYSGLYDSADNDIGVGVDYVLLRMTVSEGNS